MKLIKKLEIKKNKNGQGRMRALFYCEYCKKEIEKPYYTGLKYKSCGCYSIELCHKKQRIESPIKKENLYKIYRGMITRCYNKNGKDYKNYGGRDILICDLWKKHYIMFKIWALCHGYKKGLSIDRIDNNKGYFLQNCKFSTPGEQARNRRNTKLNWLTINIIRELYKSEYKLKELYNIFDIPYNSIRQIIANRRWKEEVI